MKMYCNVSSSQVASALERPAAEGSEMVNGHTESAPASEDSGREWRMKFEELSREHEKT